MRTTTIERIQLKGYIPTFTAVSAGNDESALTIDNKGIVSFELPDSDLMPLIKLLHSVYTQQAS